MVNLGAYANLRRLRQTRVSSFLPFILQTTELEPAVLYLAACLVGCIAVLLTFWIGADMYYFSWVLLVLTFATWPAILDAPRRILSGRKLLFAWSFLVLFVAHGLHSLEQGMEKTADSIVRALAEANNLSPLERTQIASGREFVMTGIRSGKGVLGLLKDFAERRDWNKLTSTIGEAERQSGHSMVVYISPSATEVWHRLEGKSAWWCVAGGFAIPAESGILQVRSTPNSSVVSRCLPPNYAIYGLSEERGISTKRRIEYERSLCFGDSVPGQVSLCCEVSKRSSTKLDNQM